MNLKKTLQITCITFTFAVLNFNILQYQCILIGCTNSKPRSQGKLAFLGSFFAGLASLTALFFEIKQADPKVLLKCFWAYVILTCSLSFSRSDKKKRKLLSEVVSRAFKSPQGSPFSLKNLNSFLQNCKNLVSTCIKTKKVLIYQFSDIVTAVIKLFFQQALSSPFPIPLGGFASVSFSSLSACLFFKLVLI